MAEVVVSIELFWKRKLAGALVWRGSDVTWIGAIERIEFPDRAIAEELERRMLENDFGDSGVIISGGTAPPNVGAYFDGLLRGLTAFRKRLHPEFSHRTDVVPSGLDGDVR